MGSKEHLNLNGFLAIPRVWYAYVSVPKTHTATNGSFAVPHKRHTSTGRGYTICVYSAEGHVILNTFASAAQAGHSFGCSRPTILKYAKSGEVFMGQYRLVLKKPTVELRANTECKPLIPSGCYLTSTVGISVSTLVRDRTWLPTFQRVLPWAYYSQMEA